LAVISRKLPHMRSCWCRSPMLRMHYCDTCSSFLVMGPVALVSARKGGQRRTSWHRL
jgi:hypothetical protein